MKHFSIYITICIFIFITSCNTKQSSVITFGLKRSDFREKIVANGTIQAVKTTSIVTPQIPVMSVSVSYLAEQGSHVKKGDTICILSAPEIVNRVETFTSNLETTRADLKKLEADNAMNLSMLEAQIDNNAAQVAISSLDSVQQKFAPPIKQKLLKLELEKAMVEKSKLSKKLAAQKRISESELRKMKSRIFQSENMLKMFQDQVKSLTLLAPADGIVMHVQSPMLMFMSSNGMGTIGGNIEVGSSVWSNMALLQMPDLKEMQVSVEVPEADFKRIETGQKVMIRVNAVNDLNTTGSVKKKTLVGQTKQYQDQFLSKVKTYEVIVKVDSCHSLMTPGLSAKCDIIIHDVKDTIVVPTSSIFQIDSLKTVYVLEGKKFSPFRVETGLFNSSETIVVKGLNGIEEIALIKPPQNLIKKVTKRDTQKMIAGETQKNDSLPKKIQGRDMRSAYPDVSDPKHK
jgi:multidrug efflux pump subunit AcrA (membrane-fusion protein)